MQRALPEVTVYKIVRTVRAYFFINSFIYLCDVINSIYYSLLVSYIVEVIAERDSGLLFNWSAILPY